MSLLGKLRNLRNLVSRRLPSDPRAAALLEHFGPATTAAGPPLAVVAMQCVEDPFYLGLFAVVARQLRRAEVGHRDVAVELAVHRSFNAGLQGGWASFIAWTVLLNRTISAQWLRAFGAVSSRLAYRSNSFAPTADIVDAWRSWRMWHEARATGHLDGTVIDGTACGDLVIDSYLRFRPSPRLNVEDPFVLYLLWQAHRDVRRARRYFRARQPRVYLTSYTTYIQHGVAARVALQEGTRVVSFGNLQEFGKVLTLRDTFHTRNPVHYRREFHALPNQPELLLEAQRQLDIRLSGGIDSATSYMAASAYRATTDEVPDVAGAVVVFLHDFYDSPHVYADLVFDDFWSWICFTIEKLAQASVPFLVKPHPNQIALSDEVIGDLKLRYPQLRMISSGVTNRQLVDAGMACAVTVYGTIAHEMAYLGVPSIGCARHPHIAFDFCRTALDRSSYAELLKTALVDRPDATSLRQQALQFYVMHNLAFSQAEIDLRDAFIAAWRTCHDSRRSVSEVVSCFDRMAALPAFAAFTRSLFIGIPERSETTPHASFLEAPP
ncbi:hypothetical protein [Rhizobacter fulvus]